MIVVIVEILNTSDASKFLMYVSSKLGAIRSVSLTTVDTTLEVIQPVIGLGRPVAVDYDRKNGYIYYSDVSKYMIGRRKIDGSAPNEHFLTTCMLLYRNNFLTNTCIYKQFHCNNIMYNIQ